MVGIPGELPTAYPALQATQPRCVRSPDHGVKMGLIGPGRLVLFNVDDTR